MAKLYRINDWGRHFENHRTRELKRMTYVCVPNKQDGDGYTELLDHPNGTTHYGAFMALVGAASKVGDSAAERGILLRDNGRPHDERSLARMTRVPIAIWLDSLPRLVEIGWVSAEDVVYEPLAEIPRDDAGECRPIADEVPTGRGASSESDRSGLESRESKDPTRRDAKSESGFDASIVTPETLSDVARLRRWVDHDLTRRDTICDGSEAFWTECQAAAAKARTAPGVVDPVALFKWIVRGRRWEYLRASDDEAARLLRREVDVADDPFARHLLANIGKGLSA